MIRNFRDLNQWIVLDAAARQRASISLAFVADPVFRFTILLRVNEYLVNIGLPFFLRVLPKWWFNRLSIRLGFSVPLNVFGPGLAIVHYGLLVVSPFARVGRDCRIHAGVNIGGAAGHFDLSEAALLAPRIGDRCYIGPGAKIFGPAQFGNDCAIGANAVVNGLVAGDGVTIAGMPARVVSDKGSKGLIRRATPHPARPSEESSHCVE